jgi:hypothetical protein
MEICKLAQLAAVFVTLKDYSRAKWLVSSNGENGN